MRLNAQTAPFENGSVLLPRKAPWLADYIAELTGYPGLRYADQVDSTTQALDYLRTKYASDCWITTADWDGLMRTFEGNSLEWPATLVAARWDVTSKGHRQVRRWSPRHWARDLRVSEKENTSSR